MQSLACCPGQVQLKFMKYQSMNEELCMSKVFTITWKQMKQTQTHFCTDIVHKNLQTKLRSNLSSRRLLKTQMEIVKLDKSINWVSAKSQSSKTNRFKVLNKKDNRIREPDIQREPHFTVLDPVNHLVGYPRVQVQG